MSRSPVAAIEREERVRLSALSPARGCLTSRRLGDGVPTSVGVSRGSRMLREMPWIRAVMWSQLPSRGKVQQRGTGIVDWDLQCDPPAAAQHARDHPQRTALTRRGPLAAVAARGPNEPA